MSGSTNPIKREAKESGQAVAFWFGITSPMFAGALLGWQFALLTVGVLIIAFCAFIGYVLSSSGRNAQLKNPVYQEARTRQWYMGDPLPELEPQVRWDEFEGRVSSFLRHKDDPWAPISAAHTADFLKRSAEEKPVPGEPVPGYDVDRLTGEVIALPTGWDVEYINVEQHEHPITIMRVGEYPPLPSRAAMQTIKDAHENMARAQRALKNAYAVPPHSLGTVKSEDSTPFPKPTMEDWLR